MRKWLSLILFWVIVTPLLLEFVIRVAVPFLPPPLQLAAERVVKGESLNINRLSLMTMDIDHNFMMRPNVENALYGPHETVIFHVSTVQILDSRMGFRTYPVNQGDQVDVAVVGDSFSFCFTEFEDCWVTIFEEETGLKTMNLAQGSTGSMSHWRFVDTFGRAFQPPLVIWQWFGNDFNEDYQLAVTRGEMQAIEYGETIPDYSKNAHPILIWLRSNSVAWVILETAIVGEDAYISDFERFHFTRPHEVTYNGHTLKFGQRYEQIAMNVEDPRVAAGLPMTREALLNAKTAVESWGGEFVVFLIPAREEVYAHLTTPILDADTMQIYIGAREMMRSLCEELDLRCLDLLPAMQDYARQGEHLYYSEDMHLNPRGNAIVAELVREWLAGLGLLK
jgi:hypothetical protein